MRHESLPRAIPRPITPRRVKAAERALKRERDTHPLFAEQIAEEQPTPEERIQTVEAEQAAHWQTIRDHSARTWRAARRILFSLPTDEQQRLLSEWNASTLPGRSEYFATSSGVTPDAVRRASQPSRIDLLRFRTMFLER